MFKRQVLDKMDKIQYVTVDMSKIPSHYNREYFEFFQNKTMLLLSEPVDIEDDCLCLFHTDKRASDIYPGAHDTMLAILEIMDMEPDHAEHPHLYTKDSLTQYITEMRLERYFGVGHGIVGIDGFMLNRISMQEHGKNLLEKL